MALVHGVSADKAMSFLAELRADLTNPFFLERSRMYGGRLHCTGPSFPLSIWSLTLTRRHSG